MKYKTRIKRKSKLQIVAYMQKRGWSMRGANLRGADLRGADMRGADMSGADLRGADLSSANLSSADLRGADMRGANLRSANLRGANLRYADLSSAALSSANLSGAALSSANLSGASGLLSSSEYLDDNFEFLPDGSMVVYKTFSHHFNAPDSWTIHPGAVITETCNPCRVSDCASGINVAKRDWDDFGTGDLWKLIIKPQWLAGVVVPYRTDGKIRCEKAQLIEIVDRIQED